MKILEKLSLERYQAKKNEEGYFSFAIKLNEKKFIYLQTNPEQKESIENWKNNFSSTFKVKSNDNLEKIVLFSINGISIFDENLHNRKDYLLSRSSNLYRKLEILENSNDYNTIGNIFSKIIE